MSERVANLGYMGLVKEVTKGTALTPTDFVPLYDETMSTMLNLVEDSPVAGVKMKNYQILQGMRSHKGTMTVMAEPNTSARLTDAFLTKTSTTGSNPYTHVFGLSNTTNPNSYTVDLSTGNVVFRFFGVELSKMTPQWDKNEMRWNVSMSALGSFYGREISTVTGAGPYTVTLKTTYDPSPTNGLVVGDLIRFYHGPSTTIDATVATIPSATTFTTTTNVSTMTAGDFVYLRPATPSFTLLNPFLWTNTQFCFGATASAALSATQTRLDQGTAWELTHAFSSDDGEQRSGAFDPASLVRLLGEGTFKMKKFFDTPDDVVDFNAINKKALVVRCYSGATNQYEYRVTFNNLKMMSGVDPSMKSDSVQYTEAEYHAQYDTSDAQGFGATVINALATI